MCGLSYHPLQCAQVAALSLHLYPLLHIKYQRPPVPIRLSAKLIPFLRTSTLHFIANLHGLSQCFNKTVLCFIVQKNQQLFEFVFLDSLGFVLNGAH